MRFWYANQLNCVRWGREFSEPYRLECGVRQGGLTSPKLFNLYVNDLIVELSKKPVGCWIDGICVNNLSYADDMVLLGPTAGSIRELLKVCEDYATSHGLIYNVAKSEYLIFKAPRKQVQYEPIITLKGAVLNRVTQFKYLGHYLTEDLKDHVDKERERRSLAVKCNMLARRFARCSKEVKVTALNTLRVQYNNGFRILLGLPRFCSASGMFAQERIDDFYAIIRKKTASLLTRLRSSSNSILNMLAGKFDSPILQHFMSVLVR
ncbi:uncharacterized protein LOC120626498 [Pararge aegeria]|uniref:uncharacterized protein LOC120626498 n=1 Tax=Pararge aegeria TaxID=116150 RepID=UPI0019D0349B|nr:uncharacterized protein LOC120626498 [Pararge aegeria]